MNRAEFIEATHRIELYFDKEYTTEQLKIMYEFLKETSLDRYKQAIAYCIRNNKYLPKIADLTNIEINYMQIENKEQIEFVKCKKCNGEGFIKYYEEVDNGLQPIVYEYIALCECENGKAQREINHYKFPTLSRLGL